jgi:hypothetical protein
MTKTHQGDLKSRRVEQVTGQPFSVELAVRPQASERLDVLPEGWPFRASLAIQINSGSEPNRI